MNKCISFSLSLNLRRVLCVVPFVFLFGFSQAQVKSNKGKEFWIGFMNHSEGTNAGMSLYITSDSNSSGTVSVPGQSWSTSFSVTANNLTVVTIPSNRAYVDCSGCIEKKAVKVTSDKDVIVFAHHYEGNKSDATLVLPTRTNGKEYIVMGYKQGLTAERSQFMIVGSKDSTKIKITPSVNLLLGSNGTIAANTPYMITLNEGEVYQGRAKNGGTNDDVTGTTIEVIDTGSTANCRTVAVFAGSSYTAIGGCTSGFGINSGDNLYEQMFPVNSWGRSFVMVPALGRVSDNFRFLASEDNTQVFVYKSAGAPDVLYLNAGEHADVDNVSTSRGVLANKPIAVAQFQKTSKCDGSGNIVGDPSMTILNPLEQTLKDITLYSSKFFDIDNHYINVVIPTHATSSFRIDGNSASFSTVPGFASQSFTRLTVSSGTHRLTATTGFVATAYGEGNYESYGYAAGANVKDLTASIAVTNSAQTTEVSNCLGSATKFQGQAEYSVTRWEWDFGDGTIDSIQNPNHIYADTGTYLARLYTYKPAFDGCSNYDSAFQEVNIYAKPIASFTTNPLCDSSTAIFTNTSTIPAPEEYNFTKWIINNSNPIYSLNASKYFDTIGRFPIVMEVGTKHQCKDTITDSITISPNPEAKFSAFATCFKDTTEFTNLSTISSGDIVSYTWNFDDGDTSYIQNPIHYYTYSEVFRVRLNLVSDSGCVGTYLDSVYKYPYFKADFSVKDTCLGFSSLFKNNSVISGGNFTDTTWYTSEIDTFKTFDLTKTFASAGNYTIQLIMEQDTFCLDTITKQINVHPLASADFSVTDLCFGDSTIFTDKSTISSGSYTTSWDFDNGKSGVGSPIKTSYTSQGTKNVKLTLLTDKGCNTSTTKPIVITNPKINSINKSNVCENINQLLSANVSLGLDSFISYNWKIDGTSVASTATCSYTPTTQGNKIIDLTCTTKNGCSIAFRDSILVYDNPNPNFFVNSVCRQQNFSPTNNSTITAPEVIAQNVWFLNGTQVSTNASPTLLATVDGSNSLKLVVTSLNGCKDSVTKNFTIHPLPVVGFTVGTVCLGDNTSFNDNSTINAGSNSSFSWQIDGNNNAGSSTTYTFSSTGNYDVKEIVTSNQGCRDSLTKSLTIHPLPVIDVDLNSYEGCVPFTPSVINNSTIESGSITSYDWAWGDGNTSNGISPLHSYNAEGTYNVSVTATSNFGCLSTLILGSSIIIHPSPKADFTMSPDEPSTLITPLVLRDSSSNDAVSWNWYIGDGTNLSGKYVDHIFQDSGTFAVRLIIENSDGCRDSITKFVSVNAELFVHIPTAFTPNGNDRNEQFGLSGLTQGVRKYEMKIYNRWGEMIFESLDVNEKWDGTYKGESAQAGVYLYMMQFTNPKQTKWFYHNGSVYLVR